MPEPVLGAVGEIVSEFGQSGGGGGAGSAAEGATLSNTFENGTGSPLPKLNAP